MTDKILIEGYLDKYFDSEVRSAKRKDVPIRTKYVAYRHLILTISNSFMGDLLDIFTEYISDENQTTSQIISNWFDKEQIGVREEVRALLRKCRVRRTITGWVVFDESGNLIFNSDVVTKLNRPNMQDLILNEFNIWFEDKQIEQTDKEFMI